MRVFKFGGKSLIDANGVKNVAKILKSEGADEKLIIVSAMGKTTRALENVIDQYYYKHEGLKDSIELIKKNHFKTIEGLFEDSAEVKYQIDQYFSEINIFLEKNKSKNYNYIYDQIICYGELISSAIVSKYLNSVGIENEWIDVRSYIKTDANYREAVVNWQLTHENIGKLDRKKLYLTQGFLGGAESGETTSLGLEGSDFSGGIFAYCLNAESLTIWKDVEGVLNADPRYFEDTELLKHISYEDAAEMTYYGASVIHPKTLKPLQNKQIPLYVRSYINTANKGTTVGFGTTTKPACPFFMLKESQVFLAARTTDFSLISPHQISMLFELISKYQFNINIVQKKAIGLELCLEDKFNNLDLLIKEVRKLFSINYTENCKLYTVKYPNGNQDKVLQINRPILMKQTNLDTLQVLISGAND
jgi:aspartate kinase